jgi:hypothetical protein
LATAEIYLCLVDIASQELDFSQSAQKFGTVMDLRRPASRRMPRVPARSSFRQLHQAVPIALMCRAEPSMSMNVSQSPAADEAEALEAFRQRFFMLEVWLLFCYDPIAIQCHVIHSILIETLCFLSSARSSYTVTGIGESHD